MTDTICFSLLQHAALFSLRLAADRTTTAAAAAAAAATPTTPSVDVSCTRTVPAPRAHVSSVACISSDSSSSFPLSASSTSCNNNNSSKNSEDEQTYYIEQGERLLAELPALRASLEDFGGELLEEQREQRRRRRQAAYLSRTAARSRSSSSTFTSDDDGSGGVSALSVNMGAVLDHEGNTNPFTLLPMAPEGVYLQVPSRGYVDSCRHMAVAAAANPLTTSSFSSAQQQQYGVRDDGFALRYADVVRYSSSQLHKRQHTSSGRHRGDGDDGDDGDGVAAIDTRAKACFMNDEGYLYGYAFVLCGGAFSGDGVGTNQGTAFSVSDEEEEDERGLLLCLLSSSPVVNTLRSLARQLVPHMCSVATVFAERNNNNSNSSSSTCGGKSNGALVASLYSTIAKESLLPLRELVRCNGVGVVSSASPGVPLVVTLFSHGGKGGEGRGRALPVSSTAETITLTRPWDLVHPHVDLPLSTLLLSLSHDALRLLHALLLQERRIVFIADTAQHASACAIAAPALVSPMTWAAPLIPFVPARSAVACGLLDVLLASPAGQEAQYRKLMASSSSSPVQSGSHGGVGTLGASPPSSFASTPLAQSQAAAAVCGASIPLTAHNSSSAAAVAYTSAAASAATAAAVSASARTESSGFIIGSTADIVAPLMLRAGVIAAATGGLSPAEDRIWIVDVRCGGIGVAPLEQLSYLVPVNMLPPQPRYTSGGKGKNSHQEDMASSPSISGGSPFSAPEGAEAGVRDIGSSFASNPALSSRSFAPVDSTVLVNASGKSASSSSPSSNTAAALRSAVATSHAQSPVTVVLPPPSEKLKAALRKAVSDEQRRALRVSLEALTSWRKSVLRAQKAELERLAARLERDNHGNNCERRYSSGTKDNTSAGVLKMMNHRLAAFPSISTAHIVEVHGAFLEYSVQRLWGFYRRGLTSPGYPGNSSAAGVSGGSMAMAVHSQQQQQAVQVGSGCVLNMLSVLPTGLDSHIGLARSISRTHMFRQFEKAITCVEMLGVAAVLRGTYLSGSNNNNNGNSNARSRCASNYYVAHSRMVSLLNLFYSRAQRRFPELFPELLNTIDAPRVCSGLVYRALTAPCATSSKTPHSQLGRGGSGEYVSVIQVLAGVTREDGGAGDDASSHDGGHGSPLGKHKGVRKFFSKAIKAINSGGSGSNAHVQVVGVQAYVQAFSSFGASSCNSSNRRDISNFGYMSSAEEYRMIAEQQQKAALMVEFSFAEHATGANQLNENVVSTAISAAVSSGGGSGGGGCVVDGGGKRKRSSGSAVVDTIAVCRPLPLDVMHQFSSYHALLNPLAPRDSAYTAYTLSDTAGNSSDSSGAETLEPQKAMRRGGDGEERGGEEVIGGGARHVVSSAEAKAAVMRLRGATIAPKVQPMGVVEQADVFRSLGALSPSNMRMWQHAEQLRESALLFKTTTFVVSSSVPSPSLDSSHPHAPSNTLPAPASSHVMSGRPPLHGGPPLLSSCARTPPESGSHSNISNSGLLFSQQHHLSSRRQQRVHDRSHEVEVEEGRRYVDDASENDYLSEAGVSSYPAISGSSGRGEFSPSRVSPGSAFFSAREQQQQQQSEKSREEPHYGIFERVMDSAAGLHDQPPSSYHHHQQQQQQQQQQDKAATQGIMDPWETDTITAPATAPMAAAPSSALSYDMSLFTSGAPEGYAFTAAPQPQQQQQQQMPSGFQPPSPLAASPSSPDSLSFLDGGKLVSGEGIRHVDPFYNWGSGAPAFVPTSTQQRQQQSTMPSHPSSSLPLPAASGSPILDQLFGCAPAATAPPPPSSMKRDPLDDLF